MTPAGADRPGPLPVVLDPDVVVGPDGRVLLGGDPPRLVRLSAAGAAALARLRAGEPVPALARPLLEGGLASPRPHPVPVRDVTVVVPVRDRSAELARCLAALGRAAPVLVVDDGSADPAAVARVVRAAGARLLRLPRGAGPGPARDAGLAATCSAVVAFLDSDCLPPPDWLPALLGHFADPAVGAVAPRVRAAVVAGPLLARYSAARGPLDLGPREAAVGPGGRVPYVPTAALLVRRAALPDGPAFDPALRHGEDVDLVWRLRDRGWRVHYDPRTVVRHDEPARWADWLLRRHRYGTSAAPLALRHRGRLAPLVLPPWTTAALLLLLARRPAAALGCAAVPAARLAVRLRRAGLPSGAAARTAGAAVRDGLLATATGLGGAGTVLTGPLLLALLVPRRSRAAAVALLLLPPVRDWQQRRPAVDLPRWCLLRLGDDLAYASGVWRGCWTHRTLLPLRPRTSRPA